MRKHTVLTIAVLILTGAFSAWKVGTTVAEEQSATERGTIARQSLSRYQTLSDEVGRLRAQVSELSPLVVRLGVPENRVKYTETLLALYQRTERDFPEIRSYLPSLPASRDEHSELLAALIQAQQEFAKAQLTIFNELDEQ